MSGTTSLPALLTGNPGRQNPGFQWSVICRHPPSQSVSLVAQLVKNLPAKRETWVPSLGWADPLEKGEATHSSILAWRSPWTV